MTSGGPQNTNSETSRGAKVQPEARRFALTSDPTKRPSAGRLSPRVSLVDCAAAGFASRPVVCKAQVEFWGFVGGAMQGEQGVYPVRNGHRRTQPSGRSVQSPVALLASESKLTWCGCAWISPTPSEVARGLLGGEIRACGAREWSSRAKSPIITEPLCRDHLGYEGGKNIRWESCWYEKFPRPDGERKSLR